MNEYLEAYKTLIVKESFFLIERGLSKAKFRDSHLCCEYTFHSKTIGVCFVMDWRDFIPDIDIIKIINNKIPKVYRLNENKETVRLHLSEVAVKLNLSCSNFYPQKRAPNFQILANHIKIQVKCLEESIDIILNCRENVFSVSNVAN